MNECLRFALCLAFLLLPLPAPAQAHTAQSPGALTPQEVFKRVSPSVFIVEALDSKGEVIALGSAVAVAPDQVVTNQHVVEDAVRVRVRRGNGTWSAKVTHANADHDLCRLRVEGLGFFDFLHGQRGAAKNGIELHPLVSIEAPE